MLYVNYIFNTLLDSIKSIKRKKKKRIENILEPKVAYGRATFASSVTVGVSVRLFYIKLTRP